MIYSGTFFFPYFHSLSLSLSGWLLFFLRTSAFDDLIYCSTRCQRRRLIDWRTAVVGRSPVCGWNAATLEHPAVDPTQPPPSKKKKHRKSNWHEWMKGNQSAPSASERERERVWLPLADDEPTALFSSLFTAFFLLLLSGFFLFGRRRRRRRLRDGCRTQDEWACRSRAGHPVPVLVSVPGWEGDCRFFFRHFFFCGPHLLAKKKSLPGDSHSLVGIS